MTAVATLTIAALREQGVPPLSFYDDVLLLACAAEPPPYGAKHYGDLFRTAALDPAWLAQTLLANALAEADGSMRLRDLSASTVATERSARVRTHSLDEARHARWYVAITELVFPGAVPSGLRTDIQSLIPRYTSESFITPKIDSPFSHEIGVDDLIQMNIAEIRTRIHQLIQVPILLAYAPSESKPKLEKLLQTLIVDETRHIGYTAILIDQISLINGKDSTSALFCQRMRDFNEITEEEIKALKFPSCAGCKGCTLN